MKKEISLIEGTLWKQILVFSVPLMFSNLLQVLFNISDIAVVGKFAGPMALGSVGSTSTLITLFTGLLIGLASGINVLTAMAIGSRSERDVKETVHTAAIISTITGILMLMAGLIFCRGILQLLNTKEELMEGAVNYLHIYFLGMPALALYNFGNAVFSASGNTKKPLIYLIIAGIVNVILNLIFVIGFQLGVYGVAAASAISQYLSAFLVIKDLLKTKEEFGLRPEELTITRSKAVKILQIGIPAACQYAIFCVANLFVQMGVNSFDATIVAGNSAAANADNLVYDIMAAFYTACGSFMGQNLGARKRNRVLGSYRLCLGYSFGIGLLLGGMLVVFGRPFLYLFTNETAVVDAGMERLMIMGLCYCVSAFMDCTIAANRALGKALIPTVVVILGSCVFRVAWIYTVFAVFHTTTALYLLYIFSWSITGVVEIIYFIKVYRETMERQTQTAV